MGFIILLVVVLLVSGVLYVGGKLAVGASEDEGVNYDDKNVLKYGGIVAKIVGATMLALTVLIGLPANSLHIVPAGNVGVIYTFGDITGQTGEGLVVTWPWQEVKRANVQVQTLAFMDDETKVPEGGRLIGEGLDSFSEETQNVFIDAILRIKVSPDDVQGLYRNVGPNYVNKLIPGSIAQVFKDETVDYEAVNIAPSRETIRANVEKAIKAELNRFSIDVDALLIENISFAAEFEAAIQAKQNATQEALKESELIAAETAKADQKIEAARGEAEKLKVEAAGQAEANRMLNASLTPLLVQFQAMQKLADDLQIALIPAGEGIIIDPTDLLGPLSPATE